MAINTHGGGAHTNEVGLRFEQETSLENALLMAGYMVYRDGRVSCKGSAIGIIAEKHNLYRRILEPRKIRWQDYISKKMLPDDALFVNESNTIYIIEKKFQHNAGSVDEKLQTCDFKKKQYQKLFAPLSCRVEYLYVCNDWFQKPEYRDVRDYIHSVGCHIFFNEIPLDFLKLPPIILED